MNQKLWIITLLTLTCALFSYFFLDKEIAYFFHTETLPSVKEFFIFITTFGKSEYYIIPSLILYILYRKKDTWIKNASLLVLGSVVISGIGINIIKVIVARYRPPILFKEDLYGFSWFDVGYIVNSFPSGHATTVFSAFIAFALLFPKYRYIFLILAIVIASSRVVLTVHYLSDVMVGALLGTLTSYILYQKIFKEREDEPTL